MLASFYLSIDWNHFAHSAYDTLIFLLAIGAIVFASKQFRDSKDQLARLGQQAGEIQAIAKSMSTRFIGPFPECLPEIKDVVANTDKQLNIMVDYCGYGSYSEREKFCSYLASIIEKASTDTIKVRMIIYDERQQRKSLCSQFKETEFEKVHLDSPNYHRAFPDKSGKMKVPRTWEDFVEAIFSLECKHVEMLTTAGVEIRTIPHDLLMFLWIEDAEDVAFSFRGADTSENGEWEFAFRTRDGHLIRTFSEVFEKTWSEAIPVEDKTKSGKSHEKPEPQTEPEIGIGLLDY